MSRSTETARMPSTPRCSRINGDVSPPTASSTPSRTERINAVILPSCFSPTTIPSSTSCCDSRIPRPSSCVALRRSSSMRVRGERVPCTGGAGCHPPPTTPTELGTLLRQQHRRQNNLPQQQQQQQQSTPPPPHRYPDHRIFPVITENGTDSPRQRSFSLSLTPARPRAGRAASGGSSSGVADADSDAESVKSYGSACSTASACDHATFALNGTTWSGRSRKYVVHCSNHNGDNEQYLTPTQRAARQVRKFQALLKEARKEIEEKDREIFRLTKELVELRLYKASLNSPDERTDSSDALTVRENNPFSPDSPSKDLPDEEAAGSGAAAEPTAAQPKPPSPEEETPEKQPVQPDLPSSLADSGHFEDGSIHSKDSVVYLPEPAAVHLLLGNVASRANEGESSVDAGSSSAAGNTVDHRQTDRGSDARSPSSASFPRSNVETPDVVVDEEEEEQQRRKLASLYENRIEEMHRRHIDEVQELKEKHNDKVESLLNQLADVNTRYCEVRPAVDVAEARVRELETELEAVKAELAEKKTLLDDQEERNKQMYLKMYAKGQEAARLEQDDHHQIYGQSQSKSSVTDLLRQLTVTQAELDNVKAMYRRIVEARSSQGALDPEITLQFLKSAIYYFLTDRENHQGHLNAIESILGFTEAEKRNIDKIYRSARK